MGVIHIGLPKTATTSFQNALYASRARLLSDHKILYPSIAANHTDALCTMFLDDPRKHITTNVIGITEFSEAERIRSRYRDYIEHEIEREEWNTIVFSAEGLSNLDAASLTQLRSWISRYVDKWKVLFWSRHPVNYTASVMQQMIKNGHNMEEMAEDLPLPYFQGRVSNAFEAFGKETVELTAFEDAVRENGGVVAAFCRRLGLDEVTALEISSTSSRDNESMSLLATYILDSMNRQRPFLVDGKISNARRDGEVLFIEQIKGPKFDIPAELKKRISVLARSDVQWLNDTFGTTHYIDVFDEDMANLVDPIDIASKEEIDSLAIVISDLINLAVVENVSFQREI